MADGMMKTVKTDKPQRRVQIMPQGVRKTAKQKAQDELDMAVRLLERAKTRNERVQAENATMVEKYRRLADEKEAEITVAADAFSAAQRRVEFLGTNPDLDAPDEDDTEGEDETESEDDSLV